MDLADPKPKDLLRRQTMLADIFKNFMSPFKKILATPRMTTLCLVELSILMFCTATEQQCNCFKSSELTKHL